MEKKQNAFFTKCRRISKGTAVFAVIVALSLIISAFNLAGAASSSRTKAEFTPQKTEKNPFFRKKKQELPKGEYIAKLHIRGVISQLNGTYSQKWLLDTISTLKEDEKNRGIILFIDSPGGSVYEADEAYLALESYKKETGKPVYAYFASIAASGGYYIGCASSYIMANRNTLTGSIGVIAGQFTDFSGLMEKWGIRSTTIHSGKNKTLGSYSEPLTPEQRAIMQSISDECYGQFTDIVAESRSLPKETVYEIADGRIYTARQALENGLIDAVGSFDDLADAMDRREFDFAGYEIADLFYEREETLYDMIMGAAQAFGRKAQFCESLPKAMRGIIEPEMSFPAYYYDSAHPY